MRIILDGSVSTVKRLRISLGTLVAIEATAGSKSIASAAIEAAFAAIERVNHLMHPAAAGSDLAAINAAAPGTAIQVHPGTCELLQLARQLHELTQGVFDPCLPGRPGRLEDVWLRDDLVTCARPVALDFGGFAKGYAVDCAIEALQAQGSQSGLVNAGGDVRVFGAQSDPIYLRNADGTLSPVLMQARALAVSDMDCPGRPAEHRGFYRRRPAEAHCEAAETTHRSTALPRYAAVFAGRAVIADALAKCVLLCPPAAAENVLHLFNASRLLPAPAPASPRPA